MPLSDEYVAPSELRDRIIRDAVMPRLADCSSEDGYPKTFKGLVRVRGVDVEPFGDPAGFWLVRLIIRNAYKRKIFRIQALVPKNPRSGFCGFLMRGEVLQDQDGLQVRVRSWSGLYNGIGGDNWD